MLAKLASQHFPSKYKSWSNIPLLFLVVNWVLFSTLKLVVSLEFYMFAALSHLTKNSKLQTIQTIVNLLPLNWRIFLPAACFGWTLNLIRAGFQTATCFAGLSIGSGLAFKLPPVLLCCAGRSHHSTPFDNPEPTGELPLANSALATKAVRR